MFTLRTISSIKDTQNAETDDPAMRPNVHIRSPQTREMKRAARHSWRLGRDLTRYVVINFPEPEPGDDLAPQRAFRAIRTKCRSWWDYKRRLGSGEGPLTDVRTWENKNGILHVNWLVHVPDGLVEEFNRKLALWVKTVIGERPIESMCNKSIYNMNGLLDYILKGTDPANAKRFGIDAKDQGAVWGRRACASRPLGRTARERDWAAGSLVNKTWKFKRPSIYAPAR